MRHVLDVKLKYLIKKLKSSRNHKEHKNTKHTTKDCTCSRTLADQVHQSLAKDECSGATWNSHCCIHTSKLEADAPTR